MLELGGNDPLIVMEDADLDKAAELAVQGATKNSGQRCTAVKRILVVESVADDFVELVLAKAQKLKCGDPMDPDTDVGTVIHERAATLLRARVNDAVSQGRQAAARQRPQGRALSRRPSSTTFPTTASWCARRPSGRSSRSSAARTTSRGDPDFQLDTAYGLSSGVCTNRLDYITRFINELEVGTVNVWEVPGYRIEMSPFGGIKDSGLGYKEGVGRR